MWPKRIGVLALALGALAASVSARGPSIAPVNVTIVIDQIAFTQPKVTAKVGDTVEWINKDVVDHTATSKAGGWDVAVPAGKKASLTLKTVGTFPYLCRFHPNMTATLVVER